MTETQNKPVATLSMLLERPPVALESLLAALDRPLYESLRAAVELGKWADGTALTPAQLENALQLLILFEHRHLPPAQRLFADLPTGCGAAPGAPRGSGGVQQFEPGER